MQLKWVLLKINLYLGLAVYLYKGTLYWTRSASIH